MTGRLSQNITFERGGDPGFLDQYEPPYAIQCAQSIVDNWVNKADLQPKYERSLGHYESRFERFYNVRGSQCERPYENVGFATLL